MRERTATITGATLFGLLGVAAFIKAGSYGTGGANMFPQTVAGAMVLCAAALALSELLRGGRGKAGDSIEEGLGPLGPRMLWAILVSVIFVAAIPWLGIGTASFLLITAGSFTLGLRRPVAVLAGATAFAVIVPFLFRHFLHIRPPRELVSVILGGI